MGFKIFLNKDSVDLGALLEGLGKIGNVIFVNGEICIWLQEGKTKKTISNFLKKNGVSDFFLKEINEENINFERDFVFAWFREHLNAIAVAKFEQERQEELQKMMSNIQKANDLLTDKIEEYKKLIKEGASNG